MTDNETNGIEILRGLSGSYSYGTATEESDVDLMSLVVAPPHFYYGLDGWGNSGTQQTQELDSNDILVEHKFYEIKKAIGLFAGFNPNIISLLWLNEYQYATYAGQLLVSKRTIFNSKNVYHTFVGFAYAQLCKMGGVFNDKEDENKLLKKGFEKELTLIEQNIRWHRSMKEYGSESNIRLFGFDPYDSGYLNAILKIKAFVGEEIKRIKDGPITGRMGAKRKELRDKYGYDTKFLFHTIRLMRMCIEFLEHPEEGLKVVKEAVELIKVSKKRLAEIENEFEEIKKEMDSSTDQKNEGL